MSTPETKESEQGLNDPKNNEELFAEISKAVSEGNTEEVNRLFEVGESLSDSQTPPDAKDDGHEAANEAADTGSSPDKTDSPETSATPEAAPDAASAKANDQPDIKALLDKIHRLESAAGRVDYLQARLTQLEREKKIAAKQQAEKPAETPTPAPRKSDEKIQKLKAIDPDMAETLETLREELEKEFETKFSPKQTESEVNQEDSDIQAELERLRRVHQDTDQILYGPARPLWDQWKSTLTPEQRAWAESDRAEEVSAALFAFKQAVSASQQTPPAAAQSATPEETPADDKSAQARERKLRGSTTSTNPAIKSKGVSDVDKLFSEMYNEIQQRDGLVTR